MNDPTHIPTPITDQLRARTDCGLHFESDILNSHELLERQLVQARLDCSEYEKERNDSLEREQILRDALGKIVCDFVPSNLQEHEIAIREMRECAETALLSDITKRNYVILPIAEFEKLPCKCTPITTCYRCLHIENFRKEKV